MLVWRGVCAFVAGYHWMLVAVAVGAVAVYVAGRLSWRRLWRRHAARGRWAQVTPPRTVAVEQAGDVWRLMTRLAVAAHKRGGWRLVRLPVAFEIYVDGPRLLVGVWRPTHVPFAAVVDVVEQAWPGAVAAEARPPGRGGWRRWAGFWLAVAGTDAVIVTDEPSMKAAHGRVDPLRSVLHGLHATTGPAVLQVLIRPVPASRMRRLRRIANGTAKTHGRRPTLMLVDGLLRLFLGALNTVVDLFIPGPTGSGRGGRTPAAATADDPVAADARRQAAVKAAAGPFLLAAIRVVAAGHRVRQARAAARQIIDGYDMTSAGRLRPAMLPDPTAVPDRRTQPKEWILCTVGELGVLAHLPADPASYGIDTTALHRAAPASVTRPTPERASRHLHGWTHHDGWQPPHPADPDAPPDSPSAAAIWLDDGPFFQDGDLPETDET